MPIVVDFQKDYYSHGHVLNCVQVHPGIAEVAWKTRKVDKKSMFSFRTLKRSALRDSSKGSLLHCKGAYTKVSAQRTDQDLC